MTLMAFASCMSAARFRRANSADMLETSRFTRSTSSRYVLAWHQGFYSKLQRNDGKGSCCNLLDCRPTQSRMVEDHYEVKVDGEWVRVPVDTINHVIAPDGGAHVCAPRQEGRNKGVLYCVILPSEG